MEKRSVYTLSALVIVLLISCVFLLGLGRNPSPSDLILLRAGTIDTSQEPPDVSRGLKLMGLSLEDKAYYIVQFIAPIKEEWKTKVKDVGGKFFDYLPNNAFIVKMNGDILETIRGFQEIKWIGLYQPNYKLDSQLTVKTKGMEGTITLTVQTFEAQEIGWIQHTLQELGGEILASSGSKWGGTIRVNIVPSLIPQITNLPSVKWVEEYIPPKLSNDKAAILMNVIQTEFPFRNIWDYLGLTGAGQIVAVADSGLDIGVNDSTLHPDFQGALLKAYGLGVGRGGDWSDPDGHGTHVAGSVLGRGTASGGTYKGLAYDAQLVFQSIMSSDGSLSGIPPDLNDLFLPPYNDGARIHSNSWLEPVSGAYTTSSQSVDQFMWDHKDFLILCAAGNEGIDSDSDGLIDSGSLGSPGTAKNCITVGATESNRSSPTPGYDDAWGVLWPGNYPADPIASDHVSDNGEGMAASSSRGPCLDGRIKPDMVAPGTNIISTLSSQASPPVGWGSGGLGGGRENYYVFNGGTSMATPLTAGAAALVRHYYVEKEGIPPSAALIKATLINGTKDIGGQYAEDEIVDQPKPNVAEGFGRVALMGSFFVGTNDADIVYLDETSGINTGETKLYKVDVPHVHSNMPLRIAMVWTDYPSTPVAGVNLVNDLDFTVTDPGSTVYYPNGLGTFDRRNNVEVIDIPDPSPLRGDHILSVSGFNVPNGPQPFAIVLTYYGAAVNGVEIIPYTPFPQAPTDLGGQVISPTQVDLSWTDNSDNETGFRIERKQGSTGAYQQIDTVEANIAAYSDITTAVGYTYYYRVKAYNAGGDSSPSNEISVTTGAPAGGGSGGGGGGCFISTAAYGSRMAEEVKTLEKMRDEYLLNNELGRALVSTYYKYSPSLADFIAKHPAMRRIVRIGLYPVLEVSKCFMGEIPSNER